MALKWNEMHEFRDVTTYVRSILIKSWSGRVPSAEHSFISSNRMPQIIKFFEKH